MTAESRNKPDVEAIIADIRRSIDSASVPSSGDSDRGSHDTGDLHANLDAANRACYVGQVCSCSPVGLLRRATHRVLGLLMGRRPTRSSRRSSILTGTG